MRAPVWVWALAAVLAAFSVWSYGNGRAAEALALARADSLTWARERHDSLEVERDAARADLAVAVASRDRTRDSLVEAAAEADGRSRAALGRLAAILEDSSAVPDTVRVVVRAAIGGLERQRDVCRARLGNCEATRLLLAGRIRADSASLTEKDGLLIEYQGQLHDALARRRRPAGVLRWAERGLVVYAIIRLGSDLLGGWPP